MTILSVWEGYCDDEATFEAYLVGEKVFYKQRHVALSGCPLLFQPNTCLSLAVREAHISLMALVI